MDKKLFLFQGDSVTDCDRKRDEEYDLGFGYALLAASAFAARHPQANVRFMNRGIGGNRVRDLASRWREDCIDLKPDAVSILIGINDTWRRFDMNSITTTEEYERDYRYILDELKIKLPDTKIILMDPFFLQIGDKTGWREDLDPRIAVVRELAREYNAEYLPLDAMFAERCVKSDPEQYSQDGVHPNWTGHAFIADRLLEKIEKVML